MALLHQALASASEKAYKAHYGAVNLSEKIEGGTDIPHRALASIPKAQGGKI